MISTLHTKKGVESPKTIKGWSKFLISALLTSVSIFIHVKAHKTSFDIID